MARAPKKSQSGSQKPRRSMSGGHPHSADRGAAITVLPEGMTAAEEMEMADMAEDEDVLTFPPIPLATGQVFTDAEGKPVRISAIEIVVTSEDGTESRIPLTSLHGGWWARPPF